MLVHQNSADGWAPSTSRPPLAGREATALLLAHGAHVHRFSHNPMRNQPLHACIALSRDAETVRILIAQGADVNMAQAGGYTPLHQAAAAGLEELTRILLEAGADPGSVFAIKRRRRPTTLVSGITLRWRNSCQSRNRVFFRGASAWVPRTPRFDPELAPEEGLSVSGLIVSGSGADPCLVEVTRASPAKDTRELHLSKLAFFDGWMLTVLVAAKSSTEGATPYQPRPSAWVSGDKGHL